MARMISLALVVTASACIPTTRPPVVASGEQLAVVDDVKVWTTTSKEKVAETEYKDSNGATIATGAVYADRTQVHAQNIWYPVQGTQQLADEDFFKITGDKASLDETLAMRESGRTWRNRGIGLIAGGVVVALSGLLFDDQYLRSGLSLTGALVATGGGFAIYLGMHRMNPETHALDRSVAERDANQYNAQLGGHTVGMTLGKQF